jgi:phospholipid/cholesterol/gamma-HCH transport system permease protein
MAGGRHRLICQGADHADETKEKDADADAVNHPKMNVFAGIDGHQPAQKPAFSFQMNDRFSHGGTKSTSHAKGIVSTKPRRAAGGLPQFHTWVGHPCHRHSDHGTKKPFDPARWQFYAADVRGNLAKAFELANTQVFRRAALPKSYTDLLGRKLFLFLLTVQGLGAFALITLGVILRKSGVAKNVIRPRIRQEIARAGVALLPMFFFVALALGFLVIGQTVSALAKVGAISYLGSTMVIVVVRELGPLLAAFLVLARVGTANVIELGMARSLGEVEALEALGIDPVHYLIVPRVIGMALGVFSLTIYLIIGALASGYLFAFLQDVPLTPGDYFKQIVESLGWLDFALLALKTIAFGFFIAIVTCYHGLAQPLRLEEVSRVTVRAVTQGVVVCALIDALFIVLYLVA